MNIAFDHETCKAGHASGRDSEEFISDPSPIDWFSLRSRLFAAHDLRAAWAEPDSIRPESVRLHRFGSFAGSAAFVIHTYEPVSIPVNPNASANRKPAEANVASVAGNRSTGVRG
ncbi:hypothetical protein ACLIMP_02890 [Novosphingobium aerophilum]|uniref:hypothetical protein n=1 Tax=Novosphingobium TaxID=165696 RepID=UPI00104C25C5|nr:MULTISPECIES: hypothetical protein [unclassified Novosphingobium]MPS67502.1 hypothetical protein [Novosphingobium sp.]WRT93230.1 hypothetical protein U9J33_01570 [Novosphingobium sp. RL4]